MNTKKSFAPWTLPDCGRVLLLALAATVALCLTVITIFLTFQLCAKIWPTELSSAFYAQKTAQPDAAKVPAVMPYRAQLGAENAAPNTNKKTNNATHTAQAVEPVKEKQTDDKDAVANAMTAIGTAVAVITLLFSLGTFLLNKKQEELNKLVAAERNRAERHDHQRELSVLLDRVLVPLTTHLSLTTSSVEMVMLEFQRMNLWLKLLQSDDLEVRFTAYGELTAHACLPSAGHTVPQLLTGLAQYVEECHRFHCHDLARGKSNQQTGVWCKLFDPKEFDLYKRRRTAQAVH